MPASLDRCVQDLMRQGKSEDEAYAICQAQMKKPEKIAPKATKKTTKKAPPFLKGKVPPKKKK